MNPNTNDAVEDKYGSMAVYKGLQAALSSMVSHKTGVRLARPNYFYQCFFVVDELRDMPSIPAQTNYIGTLWNDLSYYLAVDRQLTTTDESTDLIVAAIVMGTVQLLMRSKDAIMAIAGMKLITQLQRHGWNTPDISNCFDQAFEPHKDEAAQWLSRYMQQHTSIADDIAKMIDNEKTQQPRTNIYYMNGGTYTNTGAFIEQQKNM